MPNLKRKPKLFPGMQPIPAFFLNADLMEKLQISALQNGRTLIEEIEFRLERDLARESARPAPQHSGSSLEKKTVLTAKPNLRGYTKGEEVSQRPAATLVWMREEDDQLRGAAVSGESIAAISKRLCRSEKAIWHRARKIGIELPQLRKKSGLLQAPSA